MSRVLVTGHCGRVGTALTHYLRARGDQYRGFDLVEGGDMRDLGAFIEAAQGCQAIIHLAAVTTPLDAPRTYRDNIKGVWNALVAAGHAKVDRLIFASSVNAMGIFWGEALPEQLPFDESHSCRPTTAYGISKFRGERLCERFTRSSGIPTICLRPPAVWDDADIEKVRSQRSARRRREWKPFWEYGAYIHMDDLVEAFHAALHREVAGHHRLLVTADDVCSTMPSRRLARKVMRRVPWRGGTQYETQPYRTLVDNSAAKRVLGWQPAYTWER